MTSSSTLEDQLADQEDQPLEQPQCCSIVKDRSSRRATRKDLRKTGEYSKIRRTTGLTGPTGVNIHSGPVALPI